MKMKSPSKHITLKHLLIADVKQIGIQFHPDKVIHALLKDLPDIKWSNAYGMAYVKNHNDNLGTIFRTFKGVAWVNCNHFFVNKPLNSENGILSLDAYRNRKPIAEKRYCPESYLQKLELKQYAAQTAKTYISMFESFINYYHDMKLLDLDENDVRVYLQSLVKAGMSKSSLNQSVNSIKFYYEVVMQMPNRFYSIERPRTEKKLPTVLSKQEVLRIIDHIYNLKHKCIISTLYSSGMRIGELLNLKISDIDSERMMIKVVNAKGNKDRYTILSEAILPDLRKYYISYCPKTFLFEGPAGKQYAASSVQKILKRAVSKARITKKVTPHTLRHSFATHLLEAGTDLRYIQIILGHESSQTTEIYTHVAATNIEMIKSPLDSLNLGSAQNRNKQHNAVY